MPKVPVYEGNQIVGKSTPAVGFTAETSIENYGGGAANMAEPIAKAIGKAAEIYQEQKKRADQIALFDATSKLTKIENDLLYDANNGAMNKKGKDSFDLPYAVNEQYKKMSDEVYNSLSNDEQKQAFKRFQVERGFQIDRTINKHVSGEIIRYDNDVTTNFIKNEQDAAIKAYKDPSRVEMSIIQQKNAIATFGQRNGLSEDEVKQKQEMLETLTHKQVLNRMIESDDDISAQNYFNKYKDNIKGSELADVEKMIESGTIRGESQRFVADVMKSGLSEKDAIEKARSIKNPKLQDAVVERVKNEFNIKDAVERQEVEDLHKEGLNLIDSGTYRSVADIEKIPGWNKMSVGQRNSLKEYIGSRIAGKDTVTDPQTFYNLKTMASVDATKDKFIKMNLMEKRNSLSRGDFEEMVDLQAKLRQGKPESQRLLNGWRSDDQVVKDVAKSAGINPKNKEFGDFAYMVEQAQISEQEKLGRKLNNTELADLTKKLTMPIVLKERDFWFDEEKPLYKVTDEELQSVKYKDVPSAEKIKIESALKKINKPITEEAVRQLYINKILKVRNAK